MKTYYEFKDDLLNEGFLGDLFGKFMKHIAGLFQNSELLNKALQNVLNTQGTKSLTVLDPKSVKNESTFFVKMGVDGDESKDFSISLTKLADLSGGAGLFQITGTTSPEMLKALVGTNNVDDLQKNSVMAIISNKSFIKGKKAVMKIVKNMIPDGKDYTTATNVLGITSGDSVETEMKTMNN
ncbi:hypothetical protein M0P25_04755 [archaeon]|nr:hypothetical protein [archaeon]